MEEDTIQIGKQIGNYHLIEEIGVGSFGRVYRARHILTEQIVALKVLHMHLPAPEHERFMQEVQCLATLKHPHILSVMDMGLTDGRPYFISEYASGGSLRQRLNQTPLPPREQIFTILNQVGDALIYAHKQKIVHRDIKPENILFNAQGEAVLTDFAIGVVLFSMMSQEQLADLKNHLPYMAPEQFLGKFSRKSDQYALGCIAHEMLVGQLPVYPLVASKHDREKLTPLRQINPAIPRYTDEAVLKAIAVRRSFRHDDLSTFLKDVQTPLSRYRLTRQWFHDAYDLCREQRYDEALEAYDQSIRVDPKFAPAYAHKGILLSDLKRYEEAIEVLERAVSLDPDLSYAYAHKGTALYHLERYNEALEAYNQSLRIYDSYADVHNNKGNALYNLKRYEEALEAYEQALRKGPTFAPAYNNRGNALSALKLYEEALEAYECALRADHKYLAAYNNKGNTLNHLERYEEALFTFEQALYVDPNDIDACTGKMVARYGIDRSSKDLGIYDGERDALDNLEWDEEVLGPKANVYASANVASATGKIGDEDYLPRNRYWLASALRDFEEVLRLDPKHAFAYNGKGQVLLRVGRYKEALEAFEQALVIKPDYTTAYNNKGTALLSLKRYEEAVVAFEQAIKADRKRASGKKKKVRDGDNFLEEMMMALEAHEERALGGGPQNAYAYNNKGIALYHLKRYVEAIEAYDHSLRINPKNPVVYNNKGNALLDLNRYEEALAAFDQAIGVDPTYVVASNNKGNALLDLDRCEEALEAYEQALRVDPSNPVIHTNKGTALRNLERYEEAVEAFERALQFNANDAIIYANKGNALSHLERYEEALEAFEQALRVDPDNMVGYNNKGTALLALKRYEEALAAFERVLDVYPDSASLYTNKGTALYGLKHYDKAIEAFDKALSVDPDNTDAYIGKAIVLYDLDEFDAAAEAYELAHRNNADFFNNKGNTLLDLNRYEEALEAYEQALRIDPKHEDAAGNRSFILAVRKTYKIGREFGLA